MRIPKPRTNPATSSSHPRVIVHVRRWHDADRYTTYVFLGDGSVSDGADGVGGLAFDTLERIERGVLNPQKIPANARSALVAAFGQHYEDALALNQQQHPRNKIRYVKRVALRPDDSLRAAKHKTLRALSSLESGRERAYAEAYVWTTRRLAGEHPYFDKHDVDGRRDLDQGQARVEPESETETFSKAVVTSTFRGASFASRQALYQTFYRMRDGYYDLRGKGSSPSPKTKEHVTPEHALRILHDELGGLRRVTFPCSFRAVSSGGYAVVFDYHPMKATVEPDLDLVNADGTPRSAHAFFPSDDALLESFTSQTHEGALSAVIVLDLAFYEDVRARARSEISAGSSDRRSDPQIQQRLALIEHGFVTRYFPRLRDGGGRAQQGRQEGEGREQEKDGEEARVGEAVVKDELALTELEKSVGREPRATSSTVSRPPSDRSTTDRAVTTTRGNTRGLLFLQIKTDVEPLGFSRGAGQGRMPDTSIDLDVLFNLFQVSAHAPFVKYYDGYSHMYKVSRIAVHKGTLDTATLQSWIVPRGRKTGSTPYIQIVAVGAPPPSRSSSASASASAVGPGGSRRISSSSMLHGQCRITSNGRVDTMCTFPVLKPGRRRDALRTLDLVNEHVIRPLNDLNVFVRFKEVALDDSVLLEEKKGSPTLTGFVANARKSADLVNVSYTAMIDPPLKLASPTIKELARFLSSVMYPYFSLVVPVEGREDASFRAVVKRTSRHGSLMTWLTVASLIRKTALDRDEVVSRLSHIFASEESVMSRRLEELERGRFAREAFKLHHWPTLPEVPSITVVNQGYSGFRVFTNAVPSHHVHHVFRLIQYAVNNYAVYNRGKDRTSLYDYVKISAIDGADVAPTLSSSANTSGRSERTTKQRQQARREEQRETEDARDDGAVAEAGEAGEEGEERERAEEAVDAHVEELLASELDGATDADVSAASDIGEMRGDIVSSGDDVVAAAVPDSSLPHRQSSSKDSLSVADPEGGKGEVLRALYRADAELFDNRPAHGSTKYAGICGAVNDRQPIVVGEADLRRIETEYPNSFDGKPLWYGSTADLAQKNAYICPQVWCPKSRTPMTLEQFEKNGRKCPVPGVDEEPMVFTSYFEGNPARYPGLLSPEQHPEGLCMPCCFRKPEKRYDVCNIARGDKADRVKDRSFRPGETVSHTDGELLSQAPSSDDVSTDMKYILGESSVPLAEGRYGMIPSAISRPLNGDYGLMLRCGNRDDGSGHITHGTKCYVRRGIAQGRQSFLRQMLSTLKSAEEIFAPFVEKRRGEERSTTKARSSRSSVPTPPRGRAQMPGNTRGGGIAPRVSPPLYRINTITALVEHICEHLTPDIYLAMNDGMVCRMFMGTAGSHTLQVDHTRFKSFAQWFLGARAYHDALNLHGVVDLVKRGATSDPAVVREYLVYDSLAKFKAYLRDHEMVKAHKLLLGLFNMQLPWLNHLGINIVVFDRNGDVGSVGGLRDGDVTVDCESIRHDASRYRLAKPFAFIVKHGPFYERMHRVQSVRRGRLSGLRASSSGNIAAAMQGFVDDGFFMYATSDRSFREVRLVVDAILSGCLQRGEDDVNAFTNTACKSASCVIRLLRRMMGLDVRAQVLDYSFRLVGLVTRNSVFVPLHTKEAMLVGDDAPVAMYVSDVVSLRPTAKRDELREMFGALAEALGDDGYVASHEEEGGRALVLRSGRVVPLAMKPDDALFSYYLENLNIMAGTKKTDDRRAYVERLSSTRKGREAQRRSIARLLAISTEAQREYTYLRSAFNPFPFWYRRQRMRALLESVSKGAKPTKAASTGFERVHIDGKTVDDLMHGPDLFASSSSAAASTKMTKPVSSPYSSLASMRSIYGKLRTGRPGIARPDMVITEEDVATGAWLKNVEDVKQNPFSPVSPGSGASSSSSVSAGHVDGSQILARLQRDSSNTLIRAWMACGTHTSATSATSVRTTAKPLSMTSRRFRRRIMAPGSRSRSSSARGSIGALPVFSVPPSPLTSFSETSSAARMYHLIPACDVWRLFHLVSTLVTPGGRTIPLSSVRYVVANALAAALSPSSASIARDQDRGEIHDLLRGHPTLGDVLRPLLESRTAVSKSKKIVRGGQTTAHSKGVLPGAYGGVISAAMQRVIGDRDAGQGIPSEYRAGLFDVRVLSEFCGVTTIVKTVSDDDVAPSVSKEKNDDVSAASAASAAMSVGKEHVFGYGELRLYLAMRLPSQRFDLASFDDAILFMA